ncbi:hypothetical protein GW750_00695 [bacterium]|nr:hypothetical protein [bacterium]
MFSLVIVGSADGGLHTPDYTSADKTFWFIYEPAQKYTCPLIVQTHNPSHASIRAACALNLDAHTTSDTEYRKKNMYPPFGDFCMLLYKHEIEKSLHTKIDTVHKELLYLVTLYNMNINVYATPPLVYKMF